MSTGRNVNSQLRPTGATISNFPQPRSNSSRSSPDMSIMETTSTLLAAPPRAPALQRDSSTHSDGGDSVIDLYSNRLSGISTTTEAYPNVNGSLTAMYDFSGDIDNAEASRWIYRDKLLRIENQEKRKVSSASMHGGRSSNEGHGAVGDSSNLQSDNEHRSGGGYGNVDISSDEEGIDNDLDPRSEEERRQDVATTTPRRLGRATSYSRIPIATSSPAPIPQEYLERTAPLHRPESDEFETVLDTTYVRARQRSQSVGSSILLDSDKILQPVTPSPPESASGDVVRPTKPFTQSKTPMTPSPRRPTSSNKSVGISHSKSRSQPRNTTSRGGASGTTGTPSKQVALEGPPPWSLSSYTPDPRLPPDQQIIPTVAKRLQQEQWERDGLYASAYDRELRPLKVHDDSDGLPRDDGQQEASKQQDDGWPLKKNKPPVTQSPARTPAAVSVNEPVLPVVCLSILFLFLILSVVYC